jgi:hypothetical protein
MGVNVGGIGDKAIQSCTPLSGEWVRRAVWLRGSGLGEKERAPFSLGFNTAAHAVTVQGAERAMVECLERNPLICSDSWKTVL